MTNSNLLVIDIMVACGLGVGEDMFTDLGLDRMDIRIDPQGDEERWGRQNLGLDIECDHKLRHVGTVTEPVTTSNVQSR